MPRRNDSPTTEPCPSPVIYPAAPYEAKRPVGLTAEGRRLWRDLGPRYAVTPEHVVLLESALGALARAREAAKLLKRDGCCILDRFGQLKEHPAVFVERDAKSTMLRLFKALGVKTALGRMISESEDDASKDLGYAAEK